jgi:hypothetical protein
MRQEALRSGYGWLGLAVFVVCVQSYKKDSPSSGLFRVKVYNEHGMAQRNGTGMFPREVMDRFPLLPLEEEGRLNDVPLRENFIERVFGLRRKAWLSAWQFAAGKLHDRMDQDAGQGADARRLGPWQTHPGQANSIPRTS